MTNVIEVEGHFFILFWRKYPPVVIIMENILT